MKVKIKHNYYDKNIKEIITTSTEEAVKFCQKILGKRNFNNVVDDIMENWCSDVGSYIKGVYGHRSKLGRREGFYEHMMQDEVIANQVTSLEIVLENIENNEWNVEIEIFDLEHKEYLSVKFIKL